MYRVSSIVYDTRKIHSWGRFTNQGNGRTDRYLVIVWYSIAVLIFYIFPPANASIGTGKKYLSFTYSSWTNRSLTDGSMSSGVGLVNEYMNREFLSLKRLPSKMVFMRKFPTHSMAAMSFPVHSVRLTLLTKVCEFLNYDRPRNTGNNKIGQLFYFLGERLLEGQEEMPTLAWRKSNRHILHFWQW